MSTYCGTYSTGCGVDESSFIREEVTGMARFEPQTGGIGLFNLKFRAVDIEFQPPELQIKRQTSCRRPLRLLSASNPELQTPANFESRAASVEFSPRELQIKRASIEIRLYKG